MGVERCLESLNGDIKANNKLALVSSRLYDHRRGVFAS